MTKTFRFLTILLLALMALPPSVSGKISFSGKASTNETGAGNLKIIRQRYSQGVNFGLNPEQDSVFIAEINAKMDSIRKQRPTVGLVLSGGGAKGSAHVGAIRYLEEKGIPVDFVLGTSMGGLVGGFYSLGYTPAQMDSIVRNMDWFFNMTDKVPRKYIPYSEIKYKEKHLLSLPFHYDKRLTDSLDVEYAVEQKEREDRETKAKRTQEENLKNDLKRMIPSGIVYGHNVNDVIRGLSIGYHDSLDFKELPIPFACIATDLVSGKGKIWHSGSLPIALRSTMSVPGVFAPVKMEGMVLIDGGMRDNYPTDLARRMGADIVIGVDVSAGFRNYDDINNVVDIVNAGISMMGRETYELNVNVPDVTIRPDIGNLGMMSFDKASVDTMLARGYHAAAQQEARLDSIKNVVGPYTKTLQAPKALDTSIDSIHVTQIKFYGVSPKEEAILKRMLPFKAGEKVSRDQIESMEAKMVAMGAFEYTAYNLIEDKDVLGKEGKELEKKDASYTLYYYCKHSPVHKLGIGLRFDSEEILTALINVGFNVNKIEGSRHNLNLKLSANPYLEYIYSYDSPKTPTFNLSINTKWNDMGVLDFSHGNRLNMKYLHSSQKFYFSNMKWKYMDIRLGISNDIWYFPNGQPALSGEYNPIYCNGHSWTDYAGLFLDARADTFDNGYFPTRGITGGLSYKWTFARFPSHSAESLENFHTITADIRGAITAGDIFTFIPSAEISILLGRDMPLVYGNFIGGTMRGRYIEQQIPFIGVNGAVSMGPFLGLVGADFRFKIGKNHFITGTFNYVRDGIDVKDWFSDKMGNFGAGLKYSYNSIVGPMSLDLHWSDLSPNRNQFGLYLNMGFEF